MNVVCDLSSVFVFEIQTERHNVNVIYHINKNMQSL